jgi:predicted RNase H-like nuclease (RuvC/YqgF family)
MDDKATITCATCGTAFCMDAHLNKKLRESGREFFCPNGHSLSYRPSEVEKLRGQVKRLKDDIEWHSQRVKHRDAEIEHLRGQVASLRMQLGKAKKKADRIREQHTEAGLTA